MKEPKPSLRVLMVDDDEDDFILIRNLLMDNEDIDFAVDWIPNAEEAVGAIGSGDHDICLLDYRLGRHNGLEVLEQVDVHNRSMPIILLTGHGKYDVDIRAMEAGVDDYLVKDEINASLLEHSIRYAIDRRRSNMALEAAYSEMEQRVIAHTSELAKANHNLRKSSEKIKRFAYSVSHDLKGPAIAIHGLTRHLYNHYSEILDERGKKYCSQILKASEQIAAFVENINTYIATKEMPLHFTYLNLTEVCNVIREEFSSCLTSRAIGWIEPGNNQIIKADRKSMIRAIRNLVDNALKYGGDGMNRIAITYGETEEFHIISVEDNGIGLRGGDPRKIFDLFFREGTSTTTEGTGMGLAIVKEIAENHGGKAWANTSHERGVSISMSISKAL